MKNVMSRLAAVVAAAAASLDKGFDALLGLQHRAHRAPTKAPKRSRARGVWGRLIWDSNARGPAFRVYDGQGRKCYVPLHSVPMQFRRPRRERKGLWIGITPAG